MFLADNEHVIVMNIPDKKWGVPFNLDDYKRLRDEAGVTVIHDYIYWDQIEKKSKHPRRDWEIVEGQVKMARDAGMKVMFMSPISVPRYLNPDWYSAYLDYSPYMGILSFWNMEARRYQQDFLQEFMDRFTADDVTICYTGYLGEHYLWNTPVYGDRAAVEAWEKKVGKSTKLATQGTETEITQELREFIRDGVVDHLCAMQDILVKQHNETYDTTQPGIANQSLFNGSFAQPDVFKAYQERYPTADRFYISYTYWACGHGNGAVIDKMMEETGTQLIVEAAFCEGLAGQSPEMAIEGGYHKKNPHLWRGQVVAPLHRFTGHKHLEPWMLEAIKRAINVWREARCK